MIAKYLIKIRYYKKKLTVAVVSSLVPTIKFIQFIEIRIIH